QIMVYCLCGFANFASVGILIAGFGTLIPGRRDEIVPLALRAIVSGTMASGCERWMAGATVPRHRHAAAYAAIVLAGGYEESGNRGRFRVGPGDVLFHGAFDCHLDRFGAVGARIFNLVMPNVIEPRLTVAHLPDADRIVRTAERDPCVAAET